MKIYYKILPLFLALAIISCENPQGPYNRPTTKPIIKTETVWDVNVSTGAKNFVKSFRQYDQNGKILTLKLYKTGGVVSSIANYEYKDSISTEIIVKYDNGTITSKEKSEYSFNGDKITEKKSFDTLGKIVIVAKYEYDKNGNIKRKLIVNKVSNKVEEINYIYTYNSEGQLIEREVKSTDSLEVGSRDRVEYGSNNSVNIINLSPAGDILLVNTYYYNEFGMVLYILENNADGKTVRKSFFEYTYY